MLDRRVTLRRAGEQVTVLDVAMEQEPHPRLGGHRVFVQAARRRLPPARRDAAPSTGPRSPASAIAEADQGAASLLATFEQMRPADLANVLHDLSPKRRAEVAAALDDERLADVLEELPEDDQVEILGKLKEERAADVLEAMDPDDAADLLGELPPETAEQLLALMQPDDAADVRRLLSYDELHRGRHDDDRAGHPAAGRDRRRGARPGPQPRPVARARRAGVRLPAAARDARPASTSGSALPAAAARPAVHAGQRDLDTDLEPLRPDATLPQVTSFLATYNMVAVPVVDEAGRLLGAVTVDDVLDHLLPEDWRHSTPRPMRPTTAPGR